MVLTTDVVEFRVGAFLFGAELRLAFFPRLTSDLLFAEALLATAFFFMDFLGADDSPRRDFGALPSCWEDIILASCVCVLFRD